MCANLEETGLHISQLSGYQQLCRSGSSKASAVFLVDAECILDVLLQMQAMQKKARFIHASAGSGSLAAMCMRVCVCPHVLVCI